MYQPIFCISLSGLYNMTYIYNLFGKKKKLTKKRTVSHDVRYFENKNCDNSA